jgi:protein-tyrosine kinase
MSTDLADVMHWTKVDKLSVIPAGSPSSRSAEILATDRMAAMLEELKDRYSTTAI